MKILIVDDSTTMRRIIINSLRHLGFDDFAEAGDGYEALNLLHNGDIDFIIADWIMPNLDGLEMTKLIRKNEVFSDLPVLLVTVRNTAKDIVEAMQAKVSNYMLKPFTQQMLKEKIESIINPEKRKKD